MAEQADFEPALAAFTEAERSRDLRRRDLVRLYAHRAVVHFALGDRPAMEADLARLLAVHPEAALPSSAPPPVEEALKRMAELGVSPPTLVVEPVAWSDGVKVRARIAGGPPGLVRKVRIHARPGAAADWVHGERRVAVLAQPGVMVDWYVEALGPGGAVVAARGSADEPERTAVGGVARASATRARTYADVGDEDDAARARRRWWWLGSGAVVVVGAAVLTAVLLTRGGSDGSAAVGTTAMEMR